MPQPGPEPFCVAPYAAPAIPSARPTKMNPSSAWINVFSATPPNTVVASTRGRNTAMSMATAPTSAIAAPMTFTRSVHDATGGSAGGAGCGAGAFWYHGWAATYVAPQPGSSGASA